MSAPADEFDYVIRGNFRLRPPASAPNDSNVASLQGEWAMGTTYFKGDLVTLGGTAGTYYFSILDSNTGNNPGSSPMAWVQVSS